MDEGRERVGWGFELIGVLSLESLAATTAGEKEGEEDDRHQDEEPENASESDREGGRRSSVLVVVAVLRTLGGSGCGEGSSVG